MERDQQFEQGQCAQTLGHNDILFCVITTIHAF